MGMQNLVFSEGKINPNLLDEHKLIYILSTNVNAKKIFLFLLQHKVRVRGFAVKERTESDKLYSLQICLLDKIERGGGILCS